MRRIASQRGFTLPELLAVITIMGIVFAIATMSWSSIREARQVDSAANQLAADMRLAHNRATNQLTDWRVKVDVGSPDYELQKLDGVDGSVDTTATVSRKLPEGTSVKSATFDGSDEFVEFNSDGTVKDPSSSGPYEVSVGPEAGANPTADLEIITLTSRVEIK